MPVAIDGACPIERTIGSDGEEGVQLGIVRIDTRERLFADFDGRDLTRDDGLTNFAGRLKGNLGQGLSDDPRNPEETGLRRWVGRIRERVRVGQARQWIVGTVGGHARQDV